jgi:alpha-beta hydrolase superfamily lysophospholipase
MYQFLKLFPCIGLLTMASLAFSQQPTIDENARAGAIAMITSPQPEFAASPPMPSVSQLADLGLSQPNKAESISIKAKDGTPLHISLYSHQGKISVLLLHGVASSSYTYNIMAGNIRDALHANVYAMDFRGHGQSGGIKGDVDYQNQYADDVEDVLRYIQKSQPDNKTIIAGHSMGGGIALIHASLAVHSNIDGYVLFAPNLGVSSPTMKKPAPPSEADHEAFLKLHIPRIVGVYQLNQMGDSSYDHLPVMFFNMPPQVGTHQYSYRAMLSTSPGNYQQALGLIDSPLLTLVGSSDEAFDANAFPKAMKHAEQAEVHVVDGQNHNGIRHSTTAMKHLTQWAKKHALLDESI